MALLAKPCCFNRHIKYFFVVVVVVVAAGKGKEGNVRKRRPHSRPNTYMSAPSSMSATNFSGTGVIQCINGSSPNLLIGKIISYAPHNNLFHYLSLISHFKQKSKIKYYHPPGEVGWAGGGTTTGALGITKRSGESYTTMPFVFPFTACVYLLPLIY